MRPLESAAQLLAGGILAEKQNGRLRKGPVELCVADLAAARTEPLPGGERLLAAPQLLALSTFSKPAECDTVSKLTSGETVAYSMISGSCR